MTGTVRAYDRRFLRSLDLKAMGPEINTEILYKAQLLRARIVEIPAHLDWTGQPPERLEGRGRPRGMLLTTRLQIFASFLFRPLVWFVIPGLIVGLIAVWALGSVLVSTLDAFGQLDGSLDARFTEAVAQVYDRRPQSFIAGGISLVIGTQLVTAGTLALQSKRNFEETFHLGTTILRRLEDAERREGPEGADRGWFSVDEG